MQSQNNKNQLLIFVVVAVLLLFPFLGFFPLVIFLLLWWQYQKFKDQNINNKNSEYSSFLDYLRQEYENQKDKTLTAKMSKKTTNFNKEFTSREIKKPRVNSPYQVEKTSNKWLLIIVLIVSLTIVYWYLTNNDFISNFASNF